MPMNSKRNNVVLYIKQIIIQSKVITVLKKENFCNMKSWII